MKYLKLIFGILGVMAITFFIFHPKDVLGFWVVSIKKVCVGIFNLMKKWVK